MVKPCPTAFLGSSFRVADLLLKHGSLTGMHADTDQNGMFGYARYSLRTEKACSAEYLSSLIQEKTLGLAQSVEVILYA